MGEPHPCVLEHDAFIIMLHSVPPLHVALRLHVAWGRDSWGTGACGQMVGGVCPSAQAQVMCGAMACVGCWPMSDCIRSLKGHSSSNYKIIYDKKTTLAPKLHGIVAHELTAHTYGPSQWWVLPGKA